MVTEHLVSSYVGIHNDLLTGVLIARLVRFTSEPMPRCEVVGVHLRNTIQSAAHDANS